MNQWIVSSEEELLMVDGDQDGDGMCSLHETVLLGEQVDLLVGYKRKEVVYRTRGVPIDE